MIAATNWTFEEVDKMTFPRFWSMVKFWREHPPLHLLVQAFVEGVGGRQKSGTYKPPVKDGKTGKVREFTATEFEELAGIMGGCEMLPPPQQ